MSNQPLFPVPANSPGALRSCEENITALGTVAHVVEVKDAYALVHASPIGVARIASELGLPVFHSQRGGEYYAVRISAKRLALVPPVVSAPAPVGSAPVAPSVRHTVDVTPGMVLRMVLRGADYQARETSVKRRNIDVRRFEVRKDGELVQEPYVVSFQSDDGHTAQCSCPDWIYRRRQCKHIVGCQATFARARNNGQQAFAS